jgi:hypothetical protein
MKRVGKRKLDRLSKDISEARGRTPLPHPLLLASGAREPEIAGYRKLFFAITLNPRSNLAEGFVSEELRQRDVQAKGQLFHGFERSIASAALQVGNVSTMEPGSFSQLLLGKAPASSPSF